MEQSWYMDAFRGLFSLLDRFIYGTFIPMFYEFMIVLADINVFQKGAIEDFATRMYSLLAIFMLFKITFSFVMYIINPDQMMDKAKGAGSIVKNVIIVLILIIVCPRAFSLLREVQSAILTDQIIPKFILGFDSSQESNNPMQFDYYDALTNDYCGTGTGSRTAATTGDYISLMIFKNFYNGDSRNLKASDISSQLKDTDFCVPSFDGMTAYDILNSDVYNAESGDIYVINYWILISTAVGVAVALLLLTMCFDVAVRSIKLGFLEIISPIPIISYLDPNSGKSGMFKKWLTEVGKTWASLFIRLVALFFAVYVITQLEFLEVGKEFTDKYGYFVELFIIVGALMFAKQLPKLIETLTGLSVGGGFQLNPFKKVREDAMGGKLLTGAATGMAAGGLALAGGMAANSWNMAKNLNKNRTDLGGWKEGLQRTLLGTDSEGNTRKFRNGETGIRGALAGANSLRIGFRNSAGSIIGGGVSSGARSLVKAKDGTWHPLKNAGSGIAESSSRRNQRSDGIGIKEKAAEKVTSIAGIKNDYGLYGKNSDKIKNLKNQEAEFNTYEEISRKAQMEYLANSRHTAGSFTPAFSRDKAGLGEREYNAKDENKNYIYSGADEYSRYQDYMNKLNAQRTSRGEQTFDVLMQYEFDQYDRLENNTHYYNVEHQNVKKELSKAENLFKKNDK